MMTYIRIRHAYNALLLPCVAGYIATIKGEGRVTEASLIHCNDSITKGGVVGMVWHAHCSESFSSKMNKNMTVQLKVERFSIG